MEVYGSKNDPNEDWLKCAMCLQWSMSRASIHRLHANKTVWRISTIFFFFFEPYNFMGRTTWEFVTLFVKILQEDHVEKPLNHLWRSFVLWRMLMYNDRKFIIHLPKKYIRRMDFLKSPFCLKLILRLIMTLKFECGFVEWILWECFNPLIHNVPKWSDTL